MRHTVTLGFERSVREKSDPFVQVTFVVRFRAVEVRNHHTGTVRSVDLVLFVHPFRGTEEPVVVGHREDAVRPVLCRKKGGDVARFVGVNRTVTHLFRSVLRIFSGRGGQFLVPLSENADFVIPRFIFFVPLGRRRDLALVRRNGEDAGRQNEQDLVDRQPVFADRRRVGGVALRGHDLFVPAGHFIKVFGRLPRKRRFGADRGFAAFDRNGRLAFARDEGNGIGSVVFGRDGDGFVALVAAARNERKDRQDEAKRQKQKQKQVFLFHNRSPV